MAKKILIIAVFLIIITLSYAESPPIVAVIPFTSVGVSQGDAFGYTLIFETALQQTGVFEIIEQRSVHELLSAQEYAASNLTTSENAMEFGQLIAATQIILGTVGLIGEQYYLNIKRVDVETGKNLQAKNLIKDSIILNDICALPLRYLNTFYSWTVIGFEHTICCPDASWAQPTETKFVLSTRMADKPTSNKIRTIPEGCTSGACWNE